MSEFAPGIPSKTISHELPTVSERKKWELTVHDHEAERRGRHFDLRLGDPSTGHAHSWAMHAEWPKPGEKTWAIQQPTHSMRYMDFEGKIEDGYGKGDVKLFDRGKTEITNARPGHISFNVYRGSGPEEYSLHRLADKKWILMNRTLHRDQHLHLPTNKPSYRETKVDDPKIHSLDYVFSAKIDDAHNLFYFPKAGEKIRVVSYRASKRKNGDLIEHTHKVPGLLEGVPVPAGLGSTILRGGLYAISPRSGVATPTATLAGMLNSNVWKSREAQKEHGHLTSVLYDVVQYKGRKMESAPYSEKLRVLREVEAALPDHFHLPRMAFTERAKKKMVADMREGKLPETKEGIVAWHLHESSPPYKAKFSTDHDVYIRGFFPGEGRLKDRGVGGFFYSYEPDGQIVGRVGTGLSDAQRSHMHTSPEAYMGAVARVKAQERFPSGALRAPSFDAFHLDKNDPQTLAMLKLASADHELVFLWNQELVSDGGAH